MANPTMPSNMFAHPAGGAGTGGGMFNMGGMGGGGAQMQVMPSADVRPPEGLFQLQLQASCILLHIMPGSFFLDA